MPKKRGRRTRSSSPNYCDDNPSSDEDEENVKKPARKTRQAKKPSEVFASAVELRIQSAFSEINKKIEELQQKQRQQDELCLKITETIASDMSRIRMEFNQRIDDVSFRMQSHIADLRLHVAIRLNLLLPCGLADVGSAVSDSRCGPDDARRQCDADESAGSRPSHHTDWQRDASQLRAYGRQSDRRAFRRQ